MLPTGTSSKERVHAVGVSVAVGGVPVTVSVGVSVGGVPVGVSVAVGGVVVALGVVEAHGMPGLSHRAAFTIRVPKSPSQPSSGKPRYALMPTAVCPLVVLYATSGRASAHAALESAACERHLVAEEGCERSHTLH